MPAAAEAVLRDEEGRWALRFERTLNHPIERVWAALTELDDLRHWHPSPFRLEGRVGGGVDYLPPEGVAFGPGEVTSLAPPHLLVYGWGEDELRWELSEAGSGTRLVLTHTFADRAKAARDAAGWDLCLDAAARWLDGDDAPAPTGEAAIPAGWAERNRAYEQRFGIASAQAAPPPSHLAAAGALAPLVMFTGQAEAAMALYVSVFFPARIERLERYADGEDGAGLIKHATLALGDCVLQVIDSPVRHEFTFTPAISLAVRAASADAVRGIAARLSDGGSVLMPVDRYPFAECFAWVTDRFGVSWQLSFGGAYDPPPA